MFGFKDLAHFFASTAKKVVGIAKAVGPVAAKVDAKVEGNKELIENLTKLVDPRAAAIEDAAFNLFGKVCHALETGSDAANANGLSLSLDKDFITEFKTLLPAVKEFAASQGTVPPTTPTSTL